MEDEPGRGNKEPDENDIYADDNTTSSTSTSNTNEEPPPLPPRTRSTSEGCDILHDAINGQMLTNPHVGEAENQTEESDDDDIYSDAYSIRPATGDPPPLPPRKRDTHQLQEDHDSVFSSGEVQTNIDENSQPSLELSSPDQESTSSGEEEQKTPNTFQGQQIKSVLFNQGIFHHIECRDSITLQLCITRGADVNFENKTRNYLCPIHFAASMDSAECLKLLLDNQVQIDRKERRRGDTPLHIAAQYNSKDCLTILLEHGASVDSWNNDHWTPLHVAAFHGSYECLEILLKADANVEAKTQQKGSTPLHLAGQENQFNCLHLLLEHGADVEARMKKMAFTPLHLAAKGGHLQSVDLLIQYGANRSAKIITGLTALDFADLHGHEQVAQVLQNVNPQHIDLMEHGLPKEIRAMNNHSANKLQVLLQDGWFRMYEARYMIVGEYGVGKTTLAKTLVEDKISPTRQATESIDLHVGKACINVEDGTWHNHGELLGPEDMAFHRLLMYTQSTDTIHATYKRQLSERTRTFRQTRKTYTDNSDSIKQETKSEPQQFSNVDRRNRNTIANMTSKFRSVLTSTKEVQTTDLEEKLKINKERLLRKTVKACKRNLHRGNKAPVHVWDFGGQDVFYTTHQIFLTYRGIYIIVVDGSRDIDDLAPGTESLPGCSGRLTTRRYLRFWVNTILTYSKISENGFPKILVIATNFDKVPESETKKVKDKLYHDIEKEFQHQDAIKHLVLQHRFFIDTRHISEHQLGEIKAALVDLAVNQPFWGERIPKRFIHLEMELLKAQRNAQVLTMQELYAVNKQNPLGPLDQENLEMFLHLQHSMGRIIHFPVQGLNEHIILNPVFLIEAFRSIITDKTFCENDPKRHDLWKNMYERGVLAKKDIQSLWSHVRYEKFNKHRSFLVSLMVHLDFIAEPRIYISGNLIESDIYLAPCMISNIDIICWPPKDSEKKAITFSFYFKRSFLPPAIAYRFLTACVSLWTIHHVGGQTMLSSGFSVVTLDMSHLLSIKCTESRIIITLLHSSSKHLISPALANSLRESLNDILENICDVYANAFEDGSKEHCNIVYSIEIGCSMNEPCFLAPEELMKLQSMGREKWVCQVHNTDQQLSLTLRWYAQMEEFPCSNCEGIPDDLLGLEVTDEHLCKLSTQFTVNEIKELVLHLTMSMHEWHDLEYLNENAEILKIRALLTLKNKKGKLTFGELKDVICEADFNAHKMCAMTQTKALDKNIKKLMLMKIATDQDVDEVVARVGAKSLHLAVHLGISMTEWEDLKAANPKSLMQLNRSVLTLWRGKSLAKPSLNALAEALKMINISPYFLFQ